MVRLLGVSAADLSPAEVLSELVRLRKRHAAVQSLIEALEVCESLGVALPWCEGCRRPGRPGVERAA